MIYKVIPPVPGGYAFWTVSRPQIDGGPSFQEITIHRDVPHAEQLADDLCRRLNGESQLTDLTSRHEALTKERGSITELRTYLDRLKITSDNIGDIRRSLFTPWPSMWNGIVRDETAAREVRSRIEASEQGK